MSVILENNLRLLQTLQEHALTNNCSVDGHQQFQLENDTLVGTSANGSSTLPPCDLSFLLDVNSLMPHEMDNQTLHLNKSYPPEDSFDTSRFFIKEPHDMLHPMQINPAILPIVITHTLTFLVGLIGNCVVIATWSMHGKFRSPTAVFLVSLAVADLLLILVLVPLETLEYFMITWGGLSSICKTIAYVEGISAMSTVLNLVAVSMERFLVIVYPMRARSWCTMSSTRKGLIIIWGLALLLSTPVLLTKRTSQITYYNETTSLTLYYCFDVENDFTFLVAIYQLLVMFIFPGLFMGICYYVVIRQLWVSTRSVNAMTRADNSQLHRNHSMSSMTNTRMETIELSHEQDATANKVSLNRHSKWSWLRYFNLIHLWRQWQIFKMRNTLPGNGQHSKSNGTEHTKNETKKNGDVIRRESKDSSEANGRHRSRGCSWACVCCWLTCDSISSRHVGEEISECTMSSSYQMTSYSVDKRIDPSNSSRQSPVDADNLESQVYYVDSNRQTDSHGPTNHSRPLANNVMEITRSRFQVIKMLVLIIALFLLCWGPRLIMNVLVKLGLPVYSPWIYNTRIVCNLLSFVHSAVNPFVYGAMSSNFRAMLLGKCCSSSRAGKQRAAQQTRQRQQRARQQARRSTVVVAAAASEELPQKSGSQLSRY